MSSQTKLCCGGKKCPTVKLGPTTVNIVDTTVIITDDNGGSVQITVKDALSMSSTVAELCIQQLNQNND